MTHDGSRSIFIWLLDDQGSNVGGPLVVHTGIFDGSKAVGIDKSGTYILDIRADGNWTVRIEQ